MHLIVATLCVFVALATFPARLWAEQPRPVVEIPADVLEDKLRGGMLAQILGNLNGLPHEFKYIDEPGNVERSPPQDG